jgi:hypothetical protein
MIIKKRRKGVRMAISNEKKKGIALIGLGLLLLVANGWVTLRLLTLILALVVINYGFLKVGYPSLATCVHNALSALKFW